MVIIFSSKKNKDSLNVAKIINKKYRLKTLIIELDFTKKFEYEMYSDKITLNGNLIYFKKITAVWFRRMISIKPFECNHSDRLNVNESMLQSLVEHYNSEALSLCNFLTWLFREKKVNCLGYFNSISLNKLAVLDLASKLKITIPKTFITNSYKVLESRIKSNDLISKNINTFFYYEDISYKYLTPVTKITSQSKFNKTNSLFFPGAFQEFHQTSEEVKIFYIKGNFIAVKLIKQNKNSKYIDLKENFNENIKANYLNFELSKVIKYRLKMLMNQVELEIGVLDFLLINRKQLIFLEINPFGQYDYLQWGINKNFNNLIAYYLCRKS